MAEQGGEQVGFVMCELSHPHMAQGTLGGLPYVVTATVGVVTHRIAARSMLEK